VTAYIEAAGITHRGTVRDNNEDCIAIGFWVSQESMTAARHFEHDLAEPFACLVSDGMGGHNDGEQASLFVARGLARRLSVMGPSHAVAAARTVNAEFFAHVGQHPELAGMGATVVGLSSHEGRIAIFNVGDSRAYKVVPAGLAQLSVDDVPDPGWKAGSGAVRSTMLLQCYGGRKTFSDIEPHVHTEPAMVGGTYLLCCDGLYETLPEEAMAKLIGADLKASAEALLAAALAAGAKDNVTVALVRFSERADA